MKSPAIPLKAAVQTPQAFDHAGVKAATSAGLVYSRDDQPGIQRHASPDGGWVFTGPKGKPIRDPATLQRIGSLVIPPAWTNVWICTLGEGHLQATGRDARGRKQYLYHPKWAEVRACSKFERVLQFARRLPRLRQQTALDLAQPGLGKRKVLAGVVSLLEKSLIRVGNDEYLRTNGSYGLTTMQDDQVTIQGAEISFRFCGKSRVTHDITVSDRRLAMITRKCQELPGDELFQYVDDAGAVRDITSCDVNNYLRECMGKDFTAKDIRTWAGTVHAALVLQSQLSFRSLTEAKKLLRKAIVEVAAKLGNTPAVCRSSYVHPAIPAAYLAGELAMLKIRRHSKSRLTAMVTQGLSPEEKAILNFLNAQIGGGSYHQPRKSAA